MISVVFSSVAVLCSVFMICILRLDGVVKIGARWIVVGASNKSIEKDLDALMDRTKIVLFLLEECLQSCAYYCKSFDGYWNCITLYNQSKPLCLALFQYFYTSTHL
jgi:hypothetical protein